MIKFLHSFFGDSTKYLAYIYYRRIATLLYCTEENRCVVIYRNQFKTSTGIAGLEIAVGLLRRNVRDFRVAIKRQIA